MKTTIPVDDEVLGRAKVLARQRGVQVEAVVDEALRIGLERIDEIPMARPYKTHPHPLGLQPGFNLDNIQDVLARIDGEGAR